MSWHPGAQDTTSHHLLTSILIALIGKGNGKGRSWRSSYMDKDNNFQQANKGKGKGKDGGKGMKGKGKGWEKPPADTRAHAADPKDPLLLSQACFQMDRGSAAVAEKPTTTRRTSLADSAEPHAFPTWPTISCNLNWRRLQPSPSCNPASTKMPHWPKPKMAWRESKGS